MSADALLGAGVLLVCCVVSILIGAYAASRGFERALARVLKEHGIDPEQEHKTPED